MAALSEFTKYVRPEVKDCPETLILDAILRAAIDFCQKTRTVKETIPITTTIGQSTYLMSAGTDLLPEEILGVSRSVNQRLRSSSFFEFQKFGYDLLVATPMYYYMNDFNIVLGGIPIDIETLNVSVVVRPSPLATTVPDILSLRYNEEIGAGAKAKLMAMPEKPWSNPDFAMLNQNLFDKAVAAATLNDAQGGSRKGLRVTGRYF